MRMMSEYKGEKDKVDVDADDNKCEEKKLLQ